MPNESPEDDLHDPVIQEWMDTVRDPAEAASEGVRTVRVQDTVAAYEIAPLPDGRWAVKVKVAYEKGNCAGLGTPWVARGSREECLAYFLETARHHFRVSPGHAAAQAKAAERMLRKLGIGKIFREPAAHPRPEKEASEDPAERLRQARRKELMEHFPLFAEEIGREE